MYLLESVQDRLAGDKQRLGRQLLHMPWLCDIQLLRRHAPPALVRQFGKVQRQCQAILTPPPATWKSWLPAAGIEALSLDAFVILDANQIADASARALEMADSFSGQAIEDLANKGFSFNGLAVEDQAAFVALYGLAWICFWQLTGIVRAQAGPIGYVRADDPELESAARLYWFGHHWAWQSHIADIHYRGMVLDTLIAGAQSIAPRVRARVPAFVDFVEHTLDKCVSFHEAFAKHLAGKDQRHYAAMYRRLELICYLYLISHDDFRQLSGGEAVAGNRSALPTPHSPAAIVAAGFLQSDIDALADESEGHAARGEALIVRDGAGAIRVGMLGLKFALTIYLRPMLIAIEKRGDWFDKKYIPSYLQQRVGNGRYRYGPEIKAVAEKESEYDIDLTITDEAMGRLYFCQVKHRVATLHPYFRDELNEYSKNKQTVHAVDQLISTRAEFGAPVFQEKVRQSLRKAGVSPEFLARIDERFLREHTGLIVIHTIENLDFALKQGVAFYEWNSFRNLLRGQISAHSKDRVDAVALRLGDLALDDPAGISTALMEQLSAMNKENPLDSKLQWTGSRNTYLRLQCHWRLRLGNYRGLGLRGEALSFPIF